MQVLVEKTQNLGRRITISIDKNLIENTIKSELIKLSKKVFINGFRKGKVPIKVITQRYGVSVRQDVLNHLMKQQFINTLIEEKINPVGIPKYILPNDYKIGDNFKFYVEFEIYPEFILKGLEKIEVKKPIVKLDDIDIDTMIDTIRRQNANWKESNAAANFKNRIIIDFSSSMNGKELENNKIYHFLITIGEGSVPPLFEKGIIGHKAGETFIITINFSDNYHIRHLKGKSVRFKIFLKKVEEAHLPEVNINYIQQLGVKNGSIEELRARLRKNMQYELKIAIRNHIKMQILDKLVEANDIDIPSSLIQKEILFLKRKKIVHFNGSQTENYDTTSKLFQEYVKDRVMRNLILEKVIRDNNITIDEERVKYTVKEISLAYKGTSQVSNFYKNNNEIIHNVRNLLLEDQAIEFLLKKIKIIESNANYQEIMQYEKESFFCYNFI